MQILITDSGVGGLSICAYAERYLRNHDIGDSVKLTYVNAAPENDFGYNAMSSRSEKLEKFNRFLDIVSDKYSPDLIYVACNTLSVLYPDTAFSKTSRYQVRGIVETGGKYLLHELEQSPQSVAAIFGTVTTIEDGIYSEILQLNGIPKKRIIPQACPSLADVISEDCQGSRAKEKIEKFVAEMINKTELKAENYLAYLACTHYGYRSVYFSSAFEKQGFNVRVLNPNDLVVNDLFSISDRKIAEPGRENRVEVEFITRYKIPVTSLETIAFFLSAVSPKTVQAFKHYSYAPELF